MNNIDVAILALDDSNLADAAQADLEELRAENRRLEADLTEADRQLARITAELEALAVYRPILMTGNLIAIAYGDMDLEVF
jgi:hypothetical protein